MRGGRRRAAAWGPGPRWAGALLLPAAALVGALAVAVPRVLTRLEVTGPSMLPTLRPGDRLLLVRVPRWWPITQGQLVALRDPLADDGAAPVVKRVVFLAGRSVEVRGDNPSQSTDSRSYGPVGRERVLGLVVYRYAPPGRTGRVPNPVPASPEGL